MEGARSAQARASLARSSRPADTEVADNFLAAFQVPAIGGQRVCCRPALGGKHGKEAFDSVPPGYPRTTASAAIMRASAERPAPAWRARTM